MDKNKKMKEIKELVERKQYSVALKMLESMDIQTELTEKDLSVFAEVYICNKQFGKAKALLEVMFKNNATKKVISQLIFVSMIMDNISDAELYYEEYMKIAPTDTNAIVFRYRIDKAKGAIPEILISSLERLEEKSYNDEFAYELAELYDRIGETDKCIKKCNEIIVLSQNKSFENMAKSLKEKSMSSMNAMKEDMSLLKNDMTADVWKQFKEKSEELQKVDVKESVAIGDLLKEKENNSLDFISKTGSIQKNNNIENIEAKARLNIELSAKKALEDKFKAIENKKKEVEQQLKLEKGIRKELEKKISNYEVIKKSLEDKIKIQNKNKDYLEELLKKAEMNRRETDQKFNSVYEQKINLENKFNKLDELSKNQSEKLVKEVANSRKLEERLSEREIKVNQLIERLQLEEKTKSQLINTLETKEKYSENLETRLHNYEAVKAELEVKYKESLNKINILEQNLTSKNNQLDALDMQLKNIIVEKNQLEVNLHQYEQNRKLLQQNLNDHVKNKQMLENRCKQIMEHKRHIEQRYRDIEIIKNEQDVKLKEYEEKEIVLEDSLKSLREEYDDYKKQKDNEIVLEQEKYTLDMDKSKKEYDKEISNLREKCALELEETRQKIIGEKDQEIQNILNEKNQEFEKLKSESEEKENELKIEKEQLRRRLDKDVASLKQECDTQIADIKNDLEGKLLNLQSEFEKQKEQLELNINEKNMLDNTLKEKISIINSLDARLKSVMEERNKLIDHNRELDHRLGVEISNNKKLDDMVTKHIESKTDMENIIAKNQENIKNLNIKNDQRVEIIKKLEERVNFETDTKVKLEQRLHQSEVRCVDLEKELRQLKTQIKEQRDKEISLVEKSGVELLSSSIISGMSSNGIELDDIGMQNTVTDNIGIYSSINSSVSQFLDEVVDDMDDKENNDDIGINEMFEDKLEDVLEAELEKELNAEEHNNEESQSIELDDSLPMIDMKDLEAELNLSPITSNLEEVSDTDVPAPRLMNQESLNENIGSFFDSAKVPEYKKNVYPKQDISVVSQLFGTSSGTMENIESNENEKNQFYQEVMKSQMFVPFENNAFTPEIENDYKNECINSDLFAYYYYSPFIMEMVQKGICGIRNNRKNNHFVISGPDYYNKTDLSKMIAKQLSEKNIIATNKIARISGEAFNKVDLDVKAPKLLDGTVIIQNAEAVNSAAFDRLIKLINNYEGRIVVVLETNVPSAMIFANNPNASSYFKSVINLPKYTVNFALEYVVTTLSMRGMGISREAENDLANMFNTKFKNNNTFTLEELCIYVESFIESAMKRKKGKGKHPTDIIIRQDINMNW